MGGVGYRRGRTARLWCVWRVQPLRAWLSWFLTAVSTPRNSKHASQTRPYGGAIPSTLEVEDALRDACHTNGLLKRCRKPWFSEALHDREPDGETSARDNC